MVTGAARFNAKPKVGLSFLEENKLIYSGDENVDKPTSLAVFLKSCSRLDKKLLGDFISRPENVDVLRAFIGLFDFKNVRTMTSEIGSNLCFVRNLSVMPCVSCWRNSGSPCL